MNGLYLIKPTSIASTGSGNSSSISANGSVTFSSCATLSLNGVFNADYDNYMIVCRNLNTTEGNSNLFRLRASGTDASGSNYVDQYIYASSTSVFAARTTLTNGGIGFTSTNRQGYTLYVFGPYLAQPTAFRSVCGSGYATATVIDRAGTHSLSTSYDGITLLYGGGDSESGLIGVYGMVK